MGVKRSTDGKNETLSEVSTAGVNKILNKKRRTGHTQPARQRSALPPSVCGAPALLDQDQQQQAASVIQEEQDDTKEHSHHDEDDGMEWESEEEEKDNGTHHHPLPSHSPPRLNHSTVITVDATDLKISKPSSSSKQNPTRISYTKADKEAAKLIHRTHVLCLLGRAMLYDKAADDEMLQALMLSLVPLHVLKTLLKPSPTNEMNKKQQFWTIECAETLVKWFSSEFKMSPNTSQQQLTVDAIMARNSNNNDDQIAAALELGEKGVDGIIQQLTTAVEVRHGGGEELVALFVATVRGLGALARLTRVLEPSSLRPGDAVKQEEHAVKRFQKRKLQQSRGTVIDLTGDAQGAAAAAAELEKEEKEEEEMMTVAETAKVLLRKTSKKKAKKKEADTDDGLDTAPNNDDEDKNNNDKKKKSKADLELEQQLAIAMAATAFQSQPQHEEEEDSKNETTNKNGKKTNKSNASPSSLKQKPEIRRSKSASWSASLSQDIGTFWCEIFTGSLTTGTWVHVDPLTCLVGKEQQVEGLRARGSALPYVVSLMGGGSSVRDVTKRYASSFIQSQKDRDEEWWSETLLPLRKVPSELLPSSSLLQHLGQEKGKGKGGGAYINKTSLTSTTAAAAAARMLTEREDAELHELELREKMSKPGTISAFKNHPMYVLQRHISKYQCVKPGATFCGCHNGEMYFNKKDVAELHTVQKWRQLGREVVESEMNKPAKIVKKRGANGTAAATTTASTEKKKREMGRKRGMQLTCVDDTATLGDADEDNDDDGEEEGEGEGMTQLYGDWQTRELILAGAVDGKVPRNERGNVEVPPFAHAMPPGCTHLNLPGIAVMCRKLMKEMEIDYAPALVGFDYRKGGAVPKIEGVVVCEEVHQMVLERYWQDRKEREEKERKKREKEEEEARKMMEKTLEARARLEAAGVGGGGNGSRSMAEAAMSLVEAQEEVVPSGRGRKKKQKKVYKVDSEATLDLDIEEI